MASSYELMGGTLELVRSLAWTLVAYLLGTRMLAILSALVQKMGAATPAPATVADESEQIPMDLLTDIVLTESEGWAREQAADKLKELCRKYGSWNNVRAYVQQVKDGQ